MKAKRTNVFSEVRKHAKKAGLPPGTPHYTGDEVNAEPPHILVVTYDAKNYHETASHTLENWLPEKNRTGITWVNVTGLHDAALIHQLAQHFHLHPLTVEDILNIGQRPKFEEFEDYLFITLKSLVLQSSTLPTFSIEQISLVIGKNFVLSFEENNAPSFNIIKTRLQGTSNQRLRQQGSDYLAYRLIDAVIDEYFLVLETMGDQIEKVENYIITAPKPNHARTIYRLKHQMLLLRKGIWPMREVIGHLLHGEDQFITPFTRIYFRDVYDHTIQAIDTLETFRDMLSSMLDMYLSSLTNRMNEIMKTLTIIATIFIPITWIASVYGMNFPDLLGLHSRYGYPIVMGIMLLIAVLMIFYFRRKKWL